MKRMDGLDRRLTLSVLFCMYALYMRARTRTSSLSKKEKKNVDLGARASDRC
jgi:hypothetical protein